MCGIFSSTISIPYNTSPVQLFSHTMPYPRAVIFDLDNTLHSLIAARLTAISTVAAWLAGWLYHTLERSCITPFPGIPNLLTELHQNSVRLAVITNSDPREAHLRLELLGLSSYFETVVTPETFGIKKPDPAVYQKTLELLGVTAADTIMIGDRLDRDVTPAREAGMRAVHAAYGTSRPNHPCPLPNHYLSSPPTYIDTILEGTL